MEDISSVIDEKSEIDDLSNDQYTDIDETDKSSFEKDIQTSVNYKNLEEKKKTGFFSMLSNLMSSSEKQDKIDPEDTKNKEKKQRPKKQKTDPNLFLFSEVVEENHPTEENDGIEEISQISEMSPENELGEDLDTPSYLRKGSGQ